MVSDVVGVGICVVLALIVVVKSMSKRAYILPGIAGSIYAYVMVVVVRGFIEIFKEDRNAIGR